MPRIRSEFREQVLAYWRGHSQAWKLSGLTQREYCVRHNISLKSFGNWRAQLKRIALAGDDARWGHYPRLRSSVADLGPRVNPRAKTGVNPRATTPAAVAIPPPVGRRQFDDDLKRRVVAETCRPGTSASEVARRYGLDLRLLRRWRKTFGAPALPDEPVGGQP